MRQRIVVIFFFGVLGLALADAPLARGGGAESTRAINPMTKVSAPLRTAWTHRGWRTKRQWVECFVKIDGTFDENIAATFKQVGLRARSVIPQGESRTTTIVTGSIRLTQLYDLADLAFVESIDGAVPMGNKGPVGLK